MTTDEEEKSPRYVDKPDLPWRYGLFAVLVLAGFTFLPSLSVYEVMWDNIFTHLHVRQGLNLWEVGLYHFDEMGGRLQTLFVYPFDTAGWLLGRRGYQLFQLFFTLLGIGAFGWVAGVTSKSRWFGVFAAGFFLITVQNQINFDLFNAFPSLHFGGACLFGSLLCLVRALRPSGAKSGWLIAAAILFVLAGLIYEAFLLFLPVLPLVAYLTHREENEPFNPKEILRSIAPGLLALGIGSTCYIVAYFVARWTSSTEYAGTVIGDVFSSTSVGVYEQYTKAGFPLYHLAHVEKGVNGEIVDSAFPGRGEFNFLGALYHAGAGAYARALLAGWIGWICLRPMRKLSGDALWGAFILSLALVALPNLLVSITEGHQTYRYELGFTSHNLTWFCALGWSLLLATCISVMSRLIWRPLFVVCLVATSLGTDAWNVSVHQKEKAFGRKWLCMDQFFESGEFAALPDGAVVLAPSLYRARSYWEGDLYRHHEFWTLYADATSKPGIRFVRTPADFALSLAEGDSPHYFLRYDEVEAADLQAITLARVEAFESYRGASEISSRLASVFIFSPGSHATISGAWVEEASELRTIPGGVVRGGLGGFVAKVDPRFGPFRLTSETPFDPGTITISPFGGLESMWDIPRGLSPTWYSEHFYKAQPLEIADGSVGKWCWAGEKATVSLYNGGVTDIPAQLSMRLFPQGDGHYGVRFGDTFVEADLKAGEPLFIRRQPWLLEPGINTATIEVGGPSREIDGRWVNFAITGFKVYPEEAEAEVVGE